MYKGSLLLLFWLYTNELHFVWLIYNKSKSVFVKESETAALGSVWISSCFENRKCTGGLSRGGEWWTFPLTMIIKQQKHLQRQTVMNIYFSKIMPTLKHKDWALTSWKWSQLQFTIKKNVFFTLRYGKRSAQEDVVAELLFGGDNNRDQRSR